MTNLKLTAVAALSAALLLPLAIFAGTGFAQGSASSSEYEYGTTTTTPSTGKVLICHKAGKSGKHVTISVSKSAEKSFLRRGDTAGPCVGATKKHGASKGDDTTTTTTTSATTTTEREHGNTESHSNAGGNGKSNGKHK